MYGICSQEVRICIQVLNKLERDITACLLSNTLTPLINFQKSMVESETIFINKLSTMLQYTGISVYIHYKQ